MHSSALNWSVKCSQITRIPFLLKEKLGHGPLIALNVFSMSVLVALDTIV